jgi:hypothetical protein
VRGVQAPTSQGGLPPFTFLFLFFLRRRVLRRHRGRGPLLLAQLKLFISLLPALPAPDPPLLLPRRPLLFPPLRHAHAPGLGLWAGRAAQRSRPPSAREDEALESRQHMTKG